MEAFYQKIQNGEVEVKLRPPCSPGALSQAQAKILTLYTALPAEYVKFLAEHNGFTFDDIILYFVADPKSTDGSLRNASDPMELLEANISYHHEGLPETYIVLGEFEFGLFVYDAEEKEYVVLDPDGFEEFDAYEALEDLLLDLVDPEYEEDDEDL